MNDRVCSVFFFFPSYFLSTSSWLSKRNSCENSKPTRELCLDICCWTLLLFFLDKIVLVKIIILCFLTLIAIHCMSTRYFRLRFLYWTFSKRFWDHPDDKRMQKSCSDLAADLQKWANHKIIKRDNEVFYKVEHFFQVVGVKLIFPRQAQLRSSSLSSHFSSQGRFIVAPLVSFCCRLLLPFWGL